MSVDIFKKPDEFMSSLKDMIIEHIDSKVADAEAELLSQKGKTFQNATYLDLSSQFVFEIPDFTILWSKVKSVKIFVPFAIFKFDLLKKKTEFDLPWQVRLESDIDLFSEAMGDSSKALRVKFEVRFSIDYLAPGGAENTVGLKIGVSSAVPISYAGAGEISYTYKLDTEEMVSLSGELGFGYKADISALRVPLLQRAIEALELEGEGSALLTVGFVSHPREQGDRRGHLELLIGVNFEAHLSAGKFLEFLDQPSILVPSQVGLSIDAEIGTTLYDGAWDLMWRYDLKAYASSSNNSITTQAVWEKVGAGRIEFSWPTSDRVVSLSTDEVGIPYWQRTQANVANWYIDGHSDPHAWASRFFGVPS